MSHENAKGRLTAQMDQTQAAGVAIFDNDSCLAAVGEWHLATTNLMEELLAVGLPADSLMGAMLTMTVNKVIAATDLHGEERRTAE